MSPFYDYTNDRFDMYEQFIRVFNESKRLGIPLATTQLLVDAGIDTHLFETDTIKSTYPEYFI